MSIPHEFQLRFNDFDIAGGVAHHTTVFHAADSYRLAVIEASGQPIPPAPITDVQAVYLKAVKPGRGPLAVTCVLAESDGDTLITEMHIHQQEKLVATLLTRQHAPDFADIAVAALRAWM